MNADGTTRKVDPEIAAHFDVRRGLRLVSKLKTCGRRDCPRCREGVKHGPYLRLVGRGLDGRLHQLTIRPADLPRAQEAVVAVRRDRAAQRKPPVPRGDRPGRPPIYFDAPLLDHLGLRRAKGRLIELRSFPPELRWSREYQLLNAQYRALFTEGEYVALRRQAISLRHRACRLRQTCSEEKFWNDVVARRATERAEAGVGHHVQPHPPTAGGGAAS